MPKVDGAPKHMNEILESAYATCKADGGDDEKCSKIAWGAAKKAGYVKSGGKWKQLGGRRVK